MTPDKQTAKDPKQEQKKKIIIGVVVVVVLIILWQLMSGGGGAPVPGPSPVANAPAKPGAPAGGMNAARPGAPGAPAPAPEMVTPKQEKITTNPEIAKQQQQSETEYVTSLNKLQMLKLQKEIDETKTAIATAELNRMTAEKNIADMITSTQNITPAAPAPSPTQANQLPPMPPPPPQTHLPPAKPETSYTVMSVSYEGGKWSAVLSGGKITSTVGVGDIVQPDESVVTSIDRQGVVLKKDGKTRTVTISNVPM